MWPAAIGSALGRGGLRLGAGTRGRAVAADLFAPAARAAASTRAHGPAGEASTSGGSGPSRAYPTEPRVGVGVVVFRRPPVQGSPDAEVLLIRRGKEPDRGKWCFPGGSLELGETMETCAEREVMEETGLRLAGTTARGGAGSGPSSGAGGGGGLSLHDLRSGPMPFAAVDVMRREPDGRIRYHYAVIEVAALAADPDAPLVPGDDADGAQWVRVGSMRGMADLTVRCDEMAEEAVARFGRQAR
ncbi:hypothetical protein HYH03_009126 [Edaphochlamys debaryana]|uniref:Nudix hydrolase domain-containing protein n=1 Tax=Edaphochlamys debaryana TaxID=47281 RepID=A0A835Y129_9CHLO|nr:hypothetical protein HYH03_009126 [Edaphochlamys debaryana]|eukprot:KAG2492713.1 hypothetical protein HYH03_009126 [Edaphochlamys debaryana]